MPASRLRPRPTTPGGALGRPVPASPWLICSALAVSFFPAQIGGQEATRSAPLPPARASIGDTTVIDAGRFDPPVIDIGRFDPTVIDIGRFNPIPSDTGRIDTGLLDTRLFDTGPPERDYLTTSLQVGGVMAAGLGIYFYKGERNQYDAALTWDRVRERFTTTEHFRFDDNEFAMNNVAHPVAGVLYYGLARANGFGPLGATLFSVGGSTFWEVIVELREVASLNDLVSTPVTGIALGEALYQHQEFFRRSSPTWQRSGADRSHRLRIYGGPLVRLQEVPSAPVPQPGWMTTMGATSEISSVDPRDDGGVHETGGLPLTRLDLHLSFTDLLPTELHLGAETVLGAWRGGEIRDNRRGLRGHRWMVGPTTAFTMRLDHTPDTRFMGMFAAAHVLGLRGDWVLRRGPFRVRWHGASFADFSSIRPLAAQGHNSIPGLPIPHHIAVLSRNLYYYAWGGTVRSGIELDLGPVGLRGEVDHHTFRSFRSSHRRNEHAPTDRAVHDSRSYGRAWLAVRPLDGIALAAGVEEWRGEGTTGDLTLDARETRFLLRLTAAP